MYKRPVGQDLPTKEGHGGLGPRTYFSDKRCCFSIFVTQIAPKQVPITDDIPVQALQSPAVGEMPDGVSRWNALQKSLSLFEVPCKTDPTICVHRLF